MKVARVICDVVTRVGLIKEYHHRTAVKYDVIVVRIHWIKHTKLRYVLLLKITERHSHHHLWRRSRWKGSCSANENSSILVRPKQRSRDGKLVPLTNSVVPVFLSQLHYWLSICIHSVTRIPIYERLLGNVQTKYRSDPTHILLLTKSLYRKQRAELKNILQHTNHRRSRLRISTSNWKILLLLQAVPWTSAPAENTNSWWLPYL